MPVNLNGDQNCMSPFLWHHLKKSLARGVPPGEAQGQCRDVALLCGAAGLKN